jgi:CzcA family heavy metal efflux pump
MIHAIVRSSLRFRLLILGIAVGVMVVGIAQLRDAPSDVLPEFTPPYVEVQTEALGLSSEEVEQLITVPLEADLLNGVEGIETIRSQSVPGLSSIVMVFEPGTDIYKARQLVQEPLTQAHALPNVSKAPTMLQPLSSSSRVMMVSLSSEDLSPIDRSVIARWTMRPRLMGVPGVANVSIFGMRDQQLQVQVDPRTLRDKNVTLKQVIATTGNAQVASPVSYLEASTPGSGGFIETPQQRLQVRNVFDNIATPAELGRVPVEGTSGRLRLTDVANVVEDHQPLIGDAVVNDKDGLLLMIEKFPGANALEVTKGVEDALAELQPGLRGMQADTSVFRPASFIEDAIDNLTLAIVIAAVLLLLAIAAFLFHWRTVLIALVTIPVSLTAAALVLDALGETFNAISFAGLAVALAVVIDDAVVGAQNVARRLRQSRDSGSDRSVAQVVTEATHEVRSPMTYATIITLLAIVPVVVMEGRPGAFFEPLALAYALAVGAAMVVALTLTPALSLMLFSRGTSGSVDSPLTRRIAPRYDGALSRFTGRPRTALIAGGACVVLGLAVLPFLDTAVVPSFKDRDVLVRVDAQPGTSNPRMTEIATKVSSDLRDIPGVENVGAHVGRAIGADQIVDVNSSEVWASIDSGADYDKTLASIEDAVDGVQGARTEVLTYSQQKIKDVGALNRGENLVTGDGLDLLTGSDRPLAVRLYGQDQAVLRREAAKIEQVVSQVDGVRDPQIELPASQPTLEIEVDLERARAQGIKPGDVRRAEATLLQGIEVGSVFEDQKVFEVIVKGTPETRTGVASVRNLLIDKPDGGHVRLGDVADVRVARTPAVIKRDAVSRYIDVKADVSGRSVSDVQGDIEDRLANVNLPLEYHAEVLSSTAAKEINSSEMLAFGLAAAIAMFLLLQAAFRSWRLAALVTLSVPLALVGGVLGALIDGAELSLGSAIGFIALFGLAVRGSIMLVRHLENLEREEGETFGPDLVRRGARERLGPLLASTTGLALVALVFVVLGSRPGLEVVHPMAVVILSGLVTTTFLNLFVLPALYLRFAGDRRSTLSPEEELMHRWAGVEPAGATAAPAAATAAPVIADGGNGGSNREAGEGSDSGERQPAV